LNGFRIIDCNFDEILLKTFLEIKPYALQMNLLAELKETLNTNVTSKVAALLGEKEDKTKVAIESLIPTILGGLMKRASNESGAATLMNVIQKGNHDGSIVEQISHFLSSKDNLTNLTTSGHSIVSMLLPDKKSSIANLISGFAGVRNSSATTLLAIISPIILGRLGSEVKKQSLSKEGLANFLMTQKDYLLDEIPEGLEHKLVDTLGIGSLLNQESRSVNFPTATPIKSSSSPVKNYEEEERNRPNYDDLDSNSSSGIPKWLLPAILGAVALAIIGYFLFTFDWNSLNQSSAEEPVDSLNTEQVTGVKIDTTATKAVTDSTKAKDSITVAATLPAGKMIGMNLPGGSKIDLPDGSFNFQFVKYLQDSTSRAGKSLIFDNLNFESNTTALVPGADRTVMDLAKIMNAYPKVQIKLVGYTDNQGDTTANKRLSLKRAITVRDILMTQGVNQIRIDFQGKGPFNPIASNATAEGRALNRRIEMKVVRK
jgi:OmpA-OmpF porin, OOP family